MGHEKGDVRELSQRSMAAVGRLDREGWLSLFADDGIVEDPIGASFFDPEGKGHRGKVEIGAFFDAVIAPNRSVEFDIVASYECGDEVANVGTISITLATGQVGRVDGVFTYRMAPDGRLAALRAYWEQDALRFEDPS